jgi:hypothetical protein
MLEQYIEQINRYVIMPRNSAVIMQRRHHLVLMRYAVFAPTHLTCPSRLASGNDGGDRVGFSQPDFGAVLPSITRGAFAWLPAVKTPVVQARPRRAMVTAADH